MADQEPTRNRTGERDDEEIAERVEEEGIVDQQAVVAAEVEERQRDQR